MSVIQKATAHFREKLDGSLKKIHVAEWASDIYYYPSVPLKDEAGILKLQQEGKIVEALVQSLIVKARTADGGRMFQPADRVTLMNEVDPKILIRIAGEINGVDSESMEDVEKN